MIYRHLLAQLAALVILAAAYCMSAQFPLETDQDFFAACPDYVHYSTKTQ